MAYTALYRKWRPVDFDGVKGQDHIVRTLQNQIRSDRIGHAYVFCGTRGTGKTSVAKIFARAVNCEHPVDGNPCGECPSCKAIAEGKSMNVIEIDAASNNGVDNIREIRDEVQYSPTEGRYKVYIIDEVHMLSQGAYNALLKTLEEPPSYVIFILATTEVQKIPATILSRCQRYDFHRISIDTIAQQLSDLMKAEGVQVEEKAIRYVAKVADGSMRDALSLLDQCLAFYLGKDLKYENVLDVLGAVDADAFAKMLHSIRSYDTAACIRQLDEMIMQGREMSQFVSDFIWYLRNLLLVRTTKDTEKIEDIIDASAESLQQLKQDAKDTDADSLMRYIRILSELANDLRTSTQKRITVEVALIKMTRPAMEQAQDIQEMQGRLGNLEQQLTDMQLKLKEQAATGMVFSRAAEAGGSGAEGVAAGTESGQTAAGRPAVKKREITALPEDIRQIVTQWKTLVGSLEDPLTRSNLQSAHVTLGEDNSSLEIVVEKQIVRDYLQEKKEELQNQIEALTGLVVPLLFTLVEDEEDFRSKYTDIQELVHMEIEVDDKEEFI